MSDKITSIQTSTKRTYKVNPLDEPKPLDYSRLMTNGDVWRSYLLEITKRCNKKDTSVAVADKKRVLQSIIDFYTSLGISTIPMKSIITKMKRFEDARNKLCKTSKSYDNLYDQIFYIASCRCAITLNCKCDKSRPFYHDEVGFLRSQLHDKKVTVQFFRQSTNRYNGPNLLINNTNNPMNSTFINVNTLDVSDAGNEESDEDFQPDSKIQKRVRRNSSHPILVSTTDESGSPKKEIQKSYQPLIKHLLRTNTSLDKFTFLGNMLLDIKNVSPSKFIGKNTLKHQMKLMMKESRCAENIICLAFDAKVVDQLRYREKSEEIEMYSVLALPSGKLVSTVCPETRSSQDVAEKIIKILEETQSLHTLSAILCDGTNVNTGRIGGIVTLLEEHLQRSLVRIVCILHGIELVLRSIFKCKGVEWKSPDGLKGEFTDIIQDISKTSDINKNFQRINCPNIPMTPKVKADLNTDQKYFFNIFNLLRRGYHNCPAETIQFIERNSPGKMHQARWLTTASRFLRLYISLNDPSPNLASICKAIMKIYAPSWFDAKMRQSISDAASVFFNIYSRAVDYEDMEIQIAVIKSLENNSYLAHPEIVLIGMMGEEDEDLRNQAISLIKSNACIRKRPYKKPKLNPLADHYSNMIDFSSIPFTMPGLLTEEDLVNNIPIRFTGIISNSQFVERCVKLMNEASSRSCSDQTRDFIMNCTMDSRDEVSDIRRICKKDIKTLNKIL